MRTESNQIPVRISLIMKIGKAELEWAVSAVANAQRLDTTRNNAPVTTAEAHHEDSYVYQRLLEYAAKHGWLTRIDDGWILSPTAVALVQDARDEAANRRTILREWTRGYQIGNRMHWTPNTPREEIPPSPSIAWVGFMDALQPSSEQVDHVFAKRRWPWPGE